jgi:hypothetical protein
MRLVDGLIVTKFFPENTTSLIQPMDQRTIANFKKLYKKIACEKATNLLDS